jgi:hypothetical protein
MATTATDSKNHSEIGTAIVLGLVLFFLFVYLHGLKNNKVDPKAQTVAELTLANNEFLALERQHDELRASLLAGDGRLLMPILDALGGVSRLWGAPSPRQVLSLFDGETDPETATVVRQARMILKEPSAYQENIIRATTAHLRDRSTTLRFDKQRSAAGVAEATGLLIIIGMLVGWACVRGQRKIKELRSAPGTWCARSQTAIPVGEKEVDRGVWAPDPPLASLLMLMTNKAWRNIDPAAKSNTARWLMRLHLAHAKHPATAPPTPGHDNQPGGLLVHSLRLFEELCALINTDKVDLRAALVLALAHDIGKIVTLEPNRDRKGEWINSGVFHDRFSGLLLQSCPSFLKEFPGDLGEGLICAVRFHHSPEDLPLNSPGIAEVMLNLTTRADRLAASKGRMDKQAAPPPVLNPTALSAALPEVISRLGERDVVLDPENEAAWVAERTLRTLASVVLGGPLGQALIVDDAVPAAAWSSLCSSLHAGNLVVPLDEPAQLDLYNISFGGKVLHFRVPLKASALGERVAPWNSTKIDEITSTLAVSSAEVRQNQAAVAAPGQE